MSFFKKKSSAEFNDQEKESPGKSKGSLLVLLILLGGFAYLYFFTSLIVPHEAPPVATPASSPEIKQSMPPKPAVLPPVAATAAKKPEGVMPAPAAPTALPPATPAVSPAPVAAQVPAAPKAAAPVPQAAAKPVTPPAAPAPKKEAAAPVKKEMVKPALLQAPKKEEQKTAKAPAPSADKPAVKKKPGSYTIFVGEFPAGEGAAAAEAKLARLGIKPIARQEKKKSRNMNRLYYGVYSDYEAYTVALDKLKLQAKGAFAVEKDGKYYVYAGSFSSKESAEKEKRGLSAKGVSLQIQELALPLSTVRLTAGKYSAKADADKAAARLKGEGVAVKVIPTGR